MTDWERIRLALADPRWQYRTVNGIARDTGLPPDYISRLLNEHRADLRCIPVVRTEAVYTLKSRRRTWRQFLTEMLAWARA